jgi:hypothetical protein
LLGGVKRRQSQRIRHLSRRYNLRIVKSFIFRASPVWENSLRERPEKAAGCRFFLENAEKRAVYHAQTCGRANKESLLCVKLQKTRLAEISGRFRTAVKFLQGGINAAKEYEKIFALPFFCIFSGGAFRFWAGGRGCRDARVAL